MPENPDPDEFHGIDKSEQSETSETTKSTEKSEQEDAGAFAAIKRKLSGGIGRTRGAMASAAPGGYGNNDNDDYGNDDGIDIGKRRFIQGAATATGALAVADYISDGDLDADIEGNGGPLSGLLDGDDRPPVGVNRTENDTPQQTPDQTPEYTPEDTPETVDTPEDTDTPQQTPETTDTPSQTTTTEQGYTGQVDGRNYSLETIPGPVEGQGYLVDDDLLSEYDRDGWDDIIDEEEYQEELGTGTDWYLKQNALIGINERKMVSRTFPAGEFNYDTEGLYQDIAEDK